MWRFDTHGSGFFREFKPKSEISAVATETAPSSSPNVEKGQEIEVQVEPSKFPKPSLPIGSKNISIQEIIDSTVPLKPPEFFRGPYLPVFRQLNHELKSIQIDIIERFGGRVVDSVEPGKQTVIVTELSLSETIAILKHFNIINQDTLKTTKLSFVTPFYLQAWAGGQPVDLESCQPPREAPMISVPERPSSSKKRKIKAYQVGQRDEYSPEPEPVKFVKDLQPEDSKVKMDIHLKDSSDDEPDDTRPGFVKRFVCAKPSPLNSTKQQRNNAGLITAFRALGEYYEEHRHKADNEMQYLGYRRVINALKSLPIEITSSTQVQGVETLGRPKTIAKIDEYLRTGRISKLDRFVGAEETQVTNLFQTISGVGPDLATTWFKQGHRSLNDIKTTLYATLTLESQLCLDYWKDVQQRIPRAEVEEFRDLIKDVARQIDDQIQVYLVGSYRRRKPDCGDVDILLSHRYKKADSNLLLQVVRVLLDKGILTHSFVSPESFFRGLGKIDKYHRRVDIFWSDPQHIGAALVGRTGNEQFNRSMRLLAHKFGWSLSEHGLKNRKTSEPILAGATEREIFEALQLDYLAPELRNP